MPVEVTLRPLTGDDGLLPRTATWANVNWTGEKWLTYRDVEEAPGIRHYVDLRPERGDFGAVAERNGLPVGVVWALFLDAADPGYGYVGDDVPELSLCVWSGYRGQGVGGELLRAGAERGACSRGWSGHSSTTCSPPDDPDAVSSGWRRGRRASSR